jgi:hypothetical protein
MMIGHVPLRGHVQRKSQPGKIIKENINPNKIFGNFFGISCDFLMAVSIENRTFVGGY